jgi:Protein of unknown function (DUF3108).
MQRTTLLIAATILAMAPALAPAGPIAPASMQYQVGYNGLSAKGTMTMRPSGRRWVVTLKMGNALASIDQSTVFDVSDSWLRPLGSSRHVDTALSAKAIVTRYDWIARSASWSGDVKRGRAGPLALKAGDIDPLLLNVVLARDAASGTPLRYRVVDNGRARLLAFARVGRETVRVGGRDRKAIKLFAAAGGKQFVAWVVPGMALPARFIQHEANGDTIDMRAGA